MSRILLVHWHREEARERAQILVQLGHRAELLSDSERRDLGPIRRSPPDLFLIDLGRLPSQGREIGGYFRRLKPTRQVPILFVGGDRERVASARKLLPDAQFAQWERISGAIEKAIRSAPAQPVVPSTMAGYSGSPLPKKLGIRENHRVAFLNEPARFERKLAPLPKGAAITSEPGDANVAILFATSESELGRDFPAFARSLPEKTAFWIAWPKQSSRVATDLKQGFVRELGLMSGWVDYKICAIDDTWSGLCFARRKK
jgi:hypothetical protein